MGPYQVHGKNDSEIDCGWPLLKRSRGWITAFRQEIAVGDVVIVDSLAKLFGAVNVAGDFEAVFDFAFDAFGIVLRAKFAGGIVAIFLEEMKVASDAAKIGD